MTIKISFCRVDNVRLLSNHWAWLSVCEDLILTRYGEGAGLAPWPSACMYALPCPVFRRR
jgi:hypothetical protein